MAGLQVKVIARPKEGVKIPAEKLLAYDAPAAKQETGAFEKVNYSDLEDVVVWAEPAGKSARAGEVKMVTVSDKPGKLSVASIGQLVTFRNISSRAMNVYSVSDGNDFDLGTLAPGASGSYEVKSAGYIEVLTDRAKDPVAEIYAAPVRWVALTHSGETVRFADLPPGDCEVRCWHPRLPGGEARVTLRAGESSSVSVVMGVNGLPKVGR